MKMIETGIAHEQFYHMRAALPLSGVVLKKRAPLEIARSQAYELIFLLRLLWEAEAGGEGYYMGLVPEPISFGGFTVGGQAFAPGWVSWSVSYLSRTIAHEFGHNLSLRHAPCGLFLGVDFDPSFPHANGSSGVWGYEFERKRLVSPKVADLMGYCRPAWISDYSFRKALLYQAPRSRGSGAYASTLRRKEPVLAVWGVIDQEGVPSLKPAIYMDGTPSVISGDTHRLIGWTVDGSVAFEYPFTPEQVADGDGGQGFVHLIPVTWTGDLERIRLEGPGGVANMDTDTNNPLSILIRNGLIRMVSSEPMIAQSDDRVLFSRGIPR